MNICKLFISLHTETFPYLLVIKCPDISLTVWGVDRSVEAELGLGVVQRDHPDQPVRLDVVGEAGQVRVGGLITIHS